jgi:hypothetical protein
MTVNGKLCEEVIMTYFVEPSLPGYHISDRVETKVLAHNKKGVKGLTRSSCICVHARVQVRPPVQLQTKLPIFTKPNTNV